MLFVESIEDLALELREETEGCSETVFVFLKGCRRLLHTICLAGLNEGTDLHYTWANLIPNVHLNDLKLLRVIVHPAFAHKLRDLFVTEALEL